ncbi:MAG: hypothetical protein LBM95_01950 [Lactobacillales bacterium]|jgi:hypothetical protein|nr:hypothetical protein [Lactobacillales bacterium]
MENQIPVMTVGELKKKIAEIETQQGITDETKIYLNTGWDSVQEVQPNAIEVKEVVQFVVEDPLNHEKFYGMSLAERESKFEKTGKPSEQAVIINNLY